MLDVILERLGPDVRALYESRPDMVEGLVRYAVDGYPRPGGFLCALLENGFIQVLGRADSTNVAHLRAWAILITTILPGGMLRLDPDTREGRHYAHARAQFETDRLEDRLARVPAYCGELYRAFTEEGG